jgi:hypothetical protein
MRLGLEIIEHSIGNGEVDSSILSGSTSFPNKISIFSSAPKISDRSKCNDAGERVYSVTFLTRENTFRSRPEEARLAPLPWAMTMLTSRYQTRGAKEVDSLLALDSSFSLRLLRAYTSVENQNVQRQFVSLIERITANR